MIRPAADAQTTTRTKKQKGSYLVYWGAYFAAYSFKVNSFGKLAEGENTNPELRRAKVCHILLLTVGGAADTGSVRQLRRTPYAEEMAEAQQHYPCRTRDG